jgi:hypothetical protein
VGDSNPELAGGVSNEERHHLIAEGAYFRAEQRSFAPGYELDDWLAAEEEIKKKLSNPRMHSMAGNSKRSLPAMSREGAKG